MFRVSQYMRELAQAEATGHYPTPAVRGSGQPTGPVVILQALLFDLGRPSVRR
jgi:hypothetical protein